MFEFLSSPGKRGVVPAGSNALASQLYSKNVNNTSSRSSNGGDNEDFCSDASLEDDVVDLGHKVNYILLLLLLLFFSLKKPVVSRVFSSISSGMAVDTIRQRASSFFRLFISIYLTLC